MCSLPDVQRETSTEITLKWYKKQLRICRVQFRDIYLEEEYI